MATPTVVPALVATSDPAGGDEVDGSPTSLSSESLEGSLILELTPTVSSDPPQDTNIPSADVVNVNGAASEAASTVDEETVAPLNEDEIDEPKLVKRFVNTI